jgi:Icc-related predicted phosphoesterase
MRIVHASDWHGKTFKLPEADIYFFTGDMLPNFRPHVIEVAGGSRVEWQPDMELIGQVSEPKPEGVLVTKTLDHKHEAHMQQAYLFEKGYGHLSHLMGNPDAPVVMCRGNHDFTSYSNAFTSAVYEIGRLSERATTVEGLRIGGFRGMTLHRGRWSDEFSEEEFARRVAKLPEALDVLVTHNPPAGILDRWPAKDGTDQWVSLGSPSLLRYHLERSYPLKAHLFGHIHESYGTYVARGTAYSNAATGYNVIDI